MRHIDGAADVGQELPQPLRDDRRNMRVGDEEFDVRADCHDELAGEVGRREQRLVFEVKLNLDYELFQHLEH